MKTKAWYKSKTIWVNLVALVASVSAAFGFELGLTEEVQGSIVAGIMGAVNVVLRITTDSAVGGSDSPE